MTEATLIVEFLDETWMLDEGDELTFGRGGQIALDSNPKLHRVVGRLLCRTGLWWVSNEGSALYIQLVDRDSRSSITLAPGRSTPIPFANAALRISAGRSTYEILLDGTIPEIRAAEAGPDGELTETLSTPRLPLTADQRLVLVMLARARLRDPHGPVKLPTNAEVAHELGWSITKLNRKLDNLCAKFAKAGVTGLKGDSGRLATDRRERLVEHCLDTDLVLAADLPLIEQHKRAESSPPVGT